jgi:hypothetical protein
MTWLYVEDEQNAPVAVDSQFAVTPARVEVSAVDGHTVSFHDGPWVRVHWVPCTTALVRLDRGSGKARVERSFNSATCF